MFIRIISSVLLFFAVVFVPWWFYIILSAVFIWWLPHYYEAVVFGIMADILYGSSEVGLFSGSHYLMITNAILLILVLLFRDRIALHKASFL